MKAFFFLFRKYKTDLVGIAELLTFKVRKDFFLSMYLSMIKIFLILFVSFILTEEIFIILRL